MSREIKFRAWTHQDPPMPWSQKAVAITGEGEQMLPIGGTYTGVWHAFNNAADGGLIIEQFTGLKDKNGREIYEGDIVKATVRISAPYKSDTFRNVRGKIVYGPGGAFCIEEPEIFTSNNEGTERKFTTINPLFSIGSTDNIEVIGNIHENSELLGGEEEDES